jgi:hypothetical protein
MRARRLDDPPFTSTPCGGEPRQSAGERSGGRLVVGVPLNADLEEDHWLGLTARGRQKEWEQPPGRSDGPPMSRLHRHHQYEDD